MIPTNRPVLGKDLDTVRQQFGLLTADVIWLYGISITRWMQVVRKAPNEPVKDPSLALLIRLLDANPDMELIPTFPEANEMYDFINKIQEVGQKRFSMMFGAESSAAYRWMKEGGKITPPVARLMYYVRQSWLAKPPSGRLAELERWQETVSIESRARGVADIWTNGSWKQKTGKPVRRRAAAKKVAAAAADAETA